jgi:excisionase family DNA binding protein
MSEQDESQPASPLSDSLTLEAAMVATRLGLSLATINKWAKTGTMPAYRVGRSWIVFRAELDAWLASTSTDSSGTEPLPTLEQMLFGPPPFLRVAEAAQVLRVSTATVATLVARQQLGSVDLGSTHRIPIEALRTYLAAARNTA